MHNRVGIARGLVTLAQLNKAILTTPISDLEESSSECSTGGPPRPHKSMLKPNRP